MTSGTLERMVTNVPLECAGVVSTLEAGGNEYKLKGKDLDEWFQCLAFGMSGLGVLSRW